MDHVEVLRRFNRSHTQRIGVLAESYLNTGRPLGPSRLVFEIGTDRPAIADLRRRLGLDSGYLSRLLRRLEEEGLVEVTPDPADGRQRLVRLTSAGRREWRRLDARSERLARDLIAPLSERQRRELTTVLSAAERLLQAATVTFDVVDPRSRDARSAIEQYFAELNARFPAGFDPGEGGAGSDPVSLRTPNGGFVVVHSADVVVGCGGVQGIDETTGEIKRMWVHPEWRGLGLGRRLLTRLEALAGDLGCRSIVLDTNVSLTEAIAMYERAGYDSIDRYNDNPYAQRWFAKNLSRTHEHRSPV